jgi:hypothetical protein
MLKFKIRKIKQSTCIIKRCKWGVLNAVIPEDKY